MCWPQTCFGVSVETEKSLMAWSKASIRHLLQVAALMAFCSSFAHASGGSCPSGANYTNPANPQGALVTLSSLGITSCYYVAANGSDSSNSGRSETAPFLHSPGMANCSGNCSPSLLAPGVGVIFRGGDTWHFGNSSATPYAGVVSTCANNGNNAAGLCIDDINGTNANPIYYGVDNTWFTGGSWARPVLTADNPLCNADTANGTSCISNTASNCAPTAGSACTGLFYVSSCTYPNLGNTNNLVDIGYSQYILFDNFELTGICQNDLGQPSGHDDYVNYAGDQAPITIMHLYIHGWSHLQFQAPNGQPACQSGETRPCVNIEAFHGGVTAATNGGAGESVLLNVLDGADSDPVGGWVGFCGCYNTAYNVFQYNSGENSATIAFYHDNLYQYVYGNGHTNIIESAERVANAAIYDNVFRHLELPPYGDGGVILWFGPVSTTTTDYIFNNIGYDVGPSEYLNIAGTGDTNNQGNYVWFNNTWQTSTSQPILRCEAQTTGTTTDTNNHYVDDQNYILGPCGALTTTTPLAQTNAQADANISTHYDQYTASETNGYSPVASTNSTVTAGTNQYSGYCSALSTAGLSAAATACQSDTTYACSYAGNGAPPVCPARTVTARPTSTAWDIGAYEYNSQDPPPNPPTNLTDVVN
jgi:hypothetical protein